MLLSLVQLLSQKGPYSKQGDIFYKHDVHTLILKCSGCRHASRPLHLITDEWEIVSSEVSATIDYIVDGLEWISTNEGHIENISLKLQCTN